MFINAQWKTKSRIESEGGKISISEFKQHLKIPPAMVKNGIAFVWSEKEILSEIIEAMEEKGFIYIEIF